VGLRPDQYRTPARRPSAEGLAVAGDSSTVRRELTDSC